MIESPESRACAAYLLAAVLSTALPAAATNFGITNPAPAQADFHAVARELLPRSTTRRWSLPTPAV